MKELFISLNDALLIINDRIAGLMIPAAVRNSDLSITALNKMKDYREYFYSQTVCYN